MAGKISELAALATPDAADLIEVVDVSDTSMAATGTNKKLTFSQLGGGGAFYGNVRAPFNQGMYGIGGLPGRALGQPNISGGDQAMFTLGTSQGAPFYVSTGEAATVAKYGAYVVTPQAGAKLCAAVYSVPSFDNGVTGTKVAGTDVSDMPLTAVGAVTGTLAAPITLAPGQYWMAWLIYGSATPPVMSGGMLSEGFMGIDVRSGAPWAQLSLASGETSLAASYLFATYALGTSPYRVLPVAMAIYP